MWKVTEHYYVNEDSVGYTGYGVKIGETEISDITSVYEEISEFVNILNECEASEVHALELAENYIESKALPYGLCVGESA